MKRKVYVAVRNTWMTETVCRDSKIQGVFGSREQSRIPWLATLEKLTGSTSSLFGSEDSVKDGRVKNTCYV